jgi:hypothetical protein
MQIQRLPPILQTPPAPKSLSIDFLTRCQQSAELSPPPETSRNIVWAPQFISRSRSDLLDKAVDFFGSQFARIFRHTAFAVG